MTALKAQILENVYVLFASMILRFQCFFILPTVIFLMPSKQYAANVYFNKKAEKHFQKNSNEIIFSFVSHLPLDGMEMVQVTLLSRSLASSP